MTVSESPGKTPGIGSVDLYAHANPGLVATALFWIAEGHGEQRRKEDGEQIGIPVVWAIVATALVLTERVRPQLPKTSRRRLAALFNENPSWRPELAVGLRQWQIPFWEGLGYGSACRVLSYCDGRVSACGKIGSPTTEWEKETRRLSRSMGKIFAKEGTVGAMHSVFGLHAQGTR